MEERGGKKTKQKTYGSQKYRPWQIIPLGRCRVLLAEQHQQKRQKHLSKSRRRRAQMSTRPTDKKRVGSQGPLCVLKPFSRQIVSGKAIYPQKHGELKCSQWATQSVFTPLSTLKWEWGCINSSWHHTTQSRQILRYHVDVTTSRHATFT